jgi:hypothetical protein
VFEFDDRRDHREAVEPAHERVFDGLAKGEERGRRQFLIAKKYDEMVEQRPADRRCRFGREVAGEIDAGNLGPDGSGDFMHFDRSVRHFTLSHVFPYQDRLSSGTPARY